MPWNMPPLTVSSGVENEPRASEGTKKPWTSTVVTMTSMPMRANVLALASLAMSRYSVSGKLMPMMKTAMAMRRSVSSPTTGTSGRPGHTATKTCGMVSPTMTPNATMPPNANTHWAMLMAIMPGRPKQCSTVPWKLLVPLSLLLMTIRHTVQSTTTVNPISNTMPASKPVCRIAYGCPMMPAPMMELAMFMNADFIPDLGRRISCSNRPVSSPSSSSSSSVLATVTLGASISVSNGRRCDRPWLST